MIDLPDLPAPKPAPDITVGLTPARLVALLLTSEEGNTIEAQLNPAQARSLAQGLLELALIAESPEPAS